MHALHEKNAALLKDGADKRQFAMLTKLFAYFEAPIIEVKKSADALDISYNTASRPVVVLMEKGDIGGKGAGRQNNTLYTITT